MATHIKVNIIENINLLSMSYYNNLSEQPVVLSPSNIFPKRLLIFLFLPYHFNPLCILINLNAHIHPCIQIFSNVIRTLTEETRQTIFSTAGGNRNPQSSLQQLKIVS